MQLLVVEDDPFLLALYQRNLNSRKCQVSYVSDSAECIALLQRLSSLDAVLLDNHLAEEQGLALLPHIRHKFPNTAVLMVSGAAEPALIRQAFAAGVDDYVLKPINQELLWIKIEQAVESRALEQRHQAQNSELQRWVDQAIYEQQLATHVFNALAEQLTRSRVFLNCYRRASTIFSGDILLQQTAPDGSCYLLLADSMGHGLAAAIALLPVLEVFASGSAQSMPLSNLVLALNQRLCQQLPDDRFVAAVLVRLDPNGMQAEIWNGGMPDLMFVDADGLATAVASSGHMALGILDTHSLEIHSSTCDLSKVSRLIGFTDGVTDSACRDGSFLTPQQILDCWQGGAGFHELQQRLDAIERPNDDLTVFELDLQIFRQQSPAATLQHKGSITLSCELRGPILAQYDHTVELLQILQATGVPQMLSQRVYTVLCELFLNAFEHGVLQLDSALKKDAEGFVQFYQEKQQRSALLTDSDSVCFTIEWNADSGQLSIEMEDSGDGFTDRSESEQMIADGHKFSGRGIRMLRQLCQSLSYSAGGRRVKAAMQNAA